MVSRDPINLNYILIVPFRTDKVFFHLHWTFWAFYFLNLHWQIRNKSECVNPHSSAPFLFCISWSWQRLPKEPSSIFSWLEASINLLAWYQQDMWFISKIIFFYISISEGKMGARKSARTIPPCFIVLGTKFLNDSLVKNIKVQCQLVFTFKAVCTNNE